MQKIVLSVVALFVMTASALTFRSGNGSESVPANAGRTTNAAYRDGLFVGELARKNGRAHQVSTGRWASAEDRANYATGYEQAYTATLASRSAR